MGSAASRSARFQVGLSAAILALSFGGKDPQQLRHDDPKFAPYGELAVSFVVSIAATEAYNAFGPSVSVVGGCLANVFASFLGILPHSLIVLDFLLRIDSSFLWAAQWAIVSTYPSAQERTLCFIIFNLVYNIVGSVCGLVVKHLSDGEDSLCNGLMILLFAVVALLLSYGIRNPGEVVRDDGTHPPEIKYCTLSQEIRGLIKLIFSRRSFLVGLAGLDSGFSSSYVIENANGTVFYPRTGDVISALQGLAHVVGTFSIGRLLDCTFRRGRRSWGKQSILKVSIIVSTVTAVFAVGLIYQISLEDARRMAARVNPIGQRHLAFLLTYRFHKGMFQTFVYWIIGAMAENPKKVVRYGGFYKAMQNGGAAMAWAMRGLSPLKLLIVGCCLDAIGCVSLAWLALQDVENQPANLCEQMEMPQYEPGGGISAVLQRKERVPSVKEMLAYYKTGFRNRENTENPPGSGEQDPNPDDHDQGNTDEVRGEDPSEPDDPQVQALSPNPTDPEWGQQDDLI